jgi:hypothetical protein
MVVLLSFTVGWQGAATLLLLLLLLLLALVVMCRA